MKITEMHLDDFGIYHGVSWNPPEHGLIVMHGRNESGKTTLMKYVRSMFFGYLRGDWKGYFGSMGIRRKPRRTFGDFHGGYSDPLQARDRRSPQDAPSMPKARQTD